MKKVTRLLGASLAVVMSTGLGALLAAAPADASPIPLSVPITTAAPVHLAAGDRHTCAVAAGKAYCWGRNTYGNLGDGTNIDRPYAVPVRTDAALHGKTLTDISAAGHGYTCVLDSNGKPYCWGENEHSQLGDGTTSNSNIPLAVTLGALSTKHLRRVVDQYDSTCTLTNTGAVYCWGHEDRGGLGNGTIADLNATSPGAAIQTLAFSDIALGQHLGCAIGTNRRAYCWGDNDTGGVGDASNTDRGTPVAVSTTGVLSGKTISVITAGNDKGCAIDSAGAAYCWGDDSDGALGDGTNTSSNVPVAVSAGGVLSGKHLVKIETDDHHTCALDSLGAAYCWGLNSDGQLGNGTTSTSNSPVAVDMSLLPAGTTFVDIRLGFRHTCAQTSNGRTYCWGANDHGQLGDGTTVSRNKPGESVHNLPVLPSSPAGVTVHRGGNFATVSWTASADSGDPGLIGYVVTAMPGHRTCQADAATTTCRVDGLSPDVTYTFRVSAQSVVGTTLVSSVSRGRVRVIEEDLPDTGGHPGVLVLVGLTWVGLGTIMVLAATRRRRA